MKIKFYSDYDYLPLGRILSIPKCVIVINSVPKYDNKYYPQVCIHKCGYQLQKVCSAIYIAFICIFLKKLFIRQKEIQLCWYLMF